MRILEHAQSYIFCKYKMLKLLMWVSFWKHWLMLKMPNNFFGGSGYFLMFSLYDYWLRVLVPSSATQPSLARVCVSDLRMPLIWKDTDHFKNKGDFRRWERLEVHGPHQEQGGLQEVGSAWGAWTTSRTRGASLGEKRLRYMDHFKNKGDFRGWETLEVHGPLVIKL